MHTYYLRTMSANLIQWWLHIIIVLFSTIALITFWLWPRYTEWQLMRQLEAVYMELAEAKMDIEIGRSQGKVIVINDMAPNAQNTNDFFSLGLTWGHNTQEERNPNCIRSPYLDYIRLMSADTYAPSSRPLNTDSRIKKWEIIALLGKNSLAEGAQISFSRSTVTGTWQCVIYQSQAKRTLLPSHMPYNCRLAMYTILI